MQIVGGMECLFWGRNECLLFISLSPEFFSGFLYDGPYTCSLLSCFRLPLTPPVDVHLKTQTSGPPHTPVIHARVQRFGVCRNLMRGLDIITDSMQHVNLKQTPGRQQEDRSSCSSPWGSAKIVTMERLNNISVS